MAKEAKETRVTMPVMNHIENRIYELEFIDQFSECHL